MAYTQENLVNKAINVLITGGYEDVYPNATSLNDELLWFSYFGKLQWLPSNVTKWKNYIYFNKNVKNMAMLVMLVRDSCNKNVHKEWYDQWIKRGIKKWTY